MTREERAWVLYDVANSAFVLTVVTTLMPVFFKDVAAAGVAPEISTARWGFANSLAALFVAVAAPFLGTLADYGGRKIRFFAGFLAVGVLACAGLLLVDRGDWVACLAVYCVARIGFSGANVFYDAFLPDVSEKARMDRVSAAGYAYGYIGSVLPFLVCMALVHFLREPGGGAVSAAGAKAAFAVTAVWWAVLSIPLLRRVRQVHFVPLSDRPLKDGLARLMSTFRDAGQDRAVFGFLIAYFFYIDGVNTLITMSAAFGRDAGLGVGALMGAILMIQVLAFPFALAFGKMADRFTAKKALMIGIGMFSLATLFGFFLPTLQGAGAKTAAFFVLSAMVATSLGGVQALSRSYFARLIPANRSAEFFGLYNIFGKFAAVTGPALMAVFGRLGGHSRFGVLSILLLFAAGAYLLSRVRETGPA